MVLVPTVVSGREISRWYTPPVRVDGLAVELDVARGASSRPEPNLDTIILATRQSVESASVGIEIRTIGIRTEDLGTTTLVVVEVGVTVRRGGVSTAVPVSHYGAVG